MLGGRQDAVMVPPQRSGGPTNMFVQSCREERGCRIFSTDPLLQGAGRAEPRSLQDDRKRSNSRTTFMRQMDPTVCVLTTSVKSLVLRHVILCCSVREDLCCFTPTDRNRTSAGSCLGSASQTKHSSFLRSFDAQRVTRTTSSLKNSNQTQNDDKEHY